MNGFHDAKTALTELVREWFEQRPRSVNFETYSFEPVVVPDVLSLTITNVEPYRSQLIEDAQEWLSSPFFGGLGLEFGVEDFEIIRYDPWEHTISPFHFWATWANVMSAMDPVYHVESYSGVWERVVCEEGRWKIAALWSDEVRDCVRKEVAQIKFKFRKAT